MIIAATTLTLALLSLGAQERLTIGQSNELSAIKDLYAQAAFEEALTRLSGIEERVGLEQAEQYRALCLLGLGRTNEAQQSLERVVVANPLFMLTDTEVSPRLVTMFRDVRRRLLPAAAKDLYLEAKANFDAKRYPQSASQFRELIAVLDDEDMKDHADGLADLKVLGQGFMKLADAEVSAASKAAVEAATVQATQQAAAPRTLTIFTDTDAGVVAPVEIERRMPAWNPPPALARVEFRGVLDVIINERGLVEAAALRRSITPAYDPSLMQAVKFWKFKPATQNGAPVKFRKSYEIILSRR
jgi:TonB family protein